MAIIATCFPGQDDFMLLKFLYKLMTGAETAARVVNLGIRARAWGLDRC